MPPGVAPWCSSWEAEKEKPLDTYVIPEAYNLDGGEERI